MKIRHLSKTTEFIDILKTGREYRGKRITICAKLFSEQGDFSVGVIIPKKVVPLATKRNYIRRVIYAFFLNKHHEKKKKQEIVIRITKIDKNIKKRGISTEIKEELNYILEKTGIFK